MINIKRFSTTDATFDTALTALLAFENASDEGLDQRVAAILKQVKSDGDAALIELTSRFDGFRVETVSELEVSPADLRLALANLPTDQHDALQTAAERIFAYHAHQPLQDWQYDEPNPALNGAWFGQKITPLDRVGLYVPGGKAAYPSSVLMNAIPAKVAGVNELIMVVPTPNGEKNPLVFAAAALAGVDRVFTIGGAQAIGALAYGTATIPKVDKIVGPGNAYVAAAKRQVFGLVGIDMLAGPSEILIIADGKTPPEWVAMDLFSQAEHDELAQAILLCPDLTYLDSVAEAIERLLPDLPRQAIIRAALKNRGALIHVKNLAEACEISNHIAPEHLELSMENAEEWLSSIKHAGAIFIGAYASEALGDYCAGPNHVLPTSGSARFSSPLGVYDFQKRSSLICVSAPAAKVLGAVASTLAQGEGLGAHARSARYRC